MPEQKGAWWQGPNPQLLNMPRPVNPSFSAGLLSGYTVPGLVLGAGEAALEWG